MNKKSLLIGIFAGLCYSASSVFANNTALTELESGIKNMLSNDKATLMTLVDSKMSTTNKLYDNTLNTIVKQKEYRILVGNSLISSIDKDIITNKGTELKGLILTNYSNLSSEFSLLQEKLSLKIIPQTTYEQSLASLKSKLTVEVDNLGNRISTEFNGIDTFITNYGKDYDSMKSSQSTLINKIAKKEVNLVHLLELISQYSNKVEKINNLFTIKNDDIHLFQSELKGLIVDATQEKFLGLVNQYNTKNPNLVYNRSTINQYIQTIMDSVNVQIDNQFDSLIGNIYSKQDYDYFKLVKAELNNDYYSGSDIIYSNLNNDSLSLDKHYSDAVSKIYSALSGVDTKMSALDNAYDLSDLKNVLTIRFQEFADNQYVEKYEEVKKYLNDQSSLIDLQLKQDDEKYNSLIDTSESVLNMLGKTPKKLENLTTLYNNLEKSKDSFLKQEYRDSLNKLQWQIEYERISVQIAVEGLIQHIRSYPSIDVRLDKILTALYDDAVYNGRHDILRDKLIKTIGKVDSFIIDKGIEGKSKYVVLEIKKAIIKFIYLD
ncbi:MAG: hypothetical protein V3575_03515 [Candidatus Absconditabacteria bacterium]